MWRRLDQSISISPKIAALSDFERSVWLYLLPNADWFGRFPADPLVVAGVCMPLIKSDAVKITAALVKLDELRLIHLYQSGESRYLLLHDWRDWNPSGGLRNMKGRYPEPPANLCRCAAGQAAPPQTPPVDKDRDKDRDRDRDSDGPNDSPNDGPNDRARQNQTGRDGTAAVPTAVPTMPPPSFSSSTGTAPSGWPHIATKLRALYRDVDQPYLNALAAELQEYPPAVLDHAFSVVFRTCRFRPTLDELLPEIRRAERSIRAKTEKLECRWCHIVGLDAELNAHSPCPARPDYAR